MKKPILLSIALMFVVTISKAQTVTYNEDVACILNSHCFNCHNTTQSLAAISFTNYYDAWSQRNAIKYYVEKKLMPPYSPSIYQRSYTHEKTLTQAEIDLIVAWVNQGTKQGDTTLTPPKPLMAPLKSQLATADLSYRIPPYTVPDLVAFQYHCFVVPTTYPVEKRISEIEVLPSDLSAIYSVFVYSDTSQIPMQLDAADTSNGYENYAGIGSPSAKLIYGWVNGNPHYNTPAGMGIRLEANAHLVIRILFAEDAHKKTDSTQLNIKFDSTAGRILDIATWLHHDVNLLNPPFLIPADSIKTFYEKYTVPIDVSLHSVSHWAQKFCVSMNCFAVTPLSDTIPLLEIEDHEDLWSEGVYFFNKPVKIPAGSVIYGEAVYDNTVDNPNNPFFPPHNILPGLTDTGEQMLFSFLYTNYQAGDENLVADSITHQHHYSGCNPLHNLAVSFPEVDKTFSVFPNPASNFISLSLNKPDQYISIFNAQGIAVYSGKANDNCTLHITDWPNGIYFIMLLNQPTNHNLKFIKQ